MALADTDIVPGIISHFDVEKLKNDKRIMCSGGMPDRDGYFLCVQRNGDDCIWVGLTASDKPNVRDGKGRMFIELAWRQGGDENWEKNNDYLNDGSTTFKGPAQAFVDISNESPAYSSTRRSINDAGLNAIIEEIKKRGGTLL